MQREAIFEAWAPRGGAWTPWAKPVLFAHTDELASVSLPPPGWPHRSVLGEGAGLASDVAGHSRTRAVVVDLPGADGVAVGLALADFGYRPVPLYSAVPATGAVVEIWEIVHALVHAAPALERKDLPLDAPPAFLLDSRRDGGNRYVRPGDYDNRSIVFSTDFPSALLLIQAGTEGVVLIQSEDTPKADLTPVLVAWQNTSLQIHLQRADVPAAAVPIHVRRPTLVRRIVQWLREPMPDLEGRFGRRVPIPQSG